MGALAPLATGILVAAGMSVVTGALMTAMFVAQGADGASSVAFGLQLAALGLAGAGIGAVCAQVATSSRTAGTIGVLLLVAGYALRGSPTSNPPPAGCTGCPRRVGPENRPVRNERRRAGAAVRRPVRRVRAGRRTALAPARPRGRARAARPGPAGTTS
ncbi:hypothetical protein NKG05_17100 [Oerskovia sp. M15]